MRGVVSRGVRCRGVGCAVWGVRVGVWCVV